jgi:hypothetical protein
MKNYNLKAFTILLFVIIIATSCKKNNDDEPQPQLPITEDEKDFDTLSLPTSFQQNILFEGFSGCWCGYCPTMDLEFHNELASHSGRIYAAISHIGDDLNIPEADSLFSFFQMGGVPNQVTNYFRGGSSSYDFWLAQTQKFGVSVSSSIEGNTAKIKVLTGFNQNMNINMKLVVFLTEDSIHGPDYAQANNYNTNPASPFYGLGSYIMDFRHDYVLRKVISTSCLGDVIPVGNTSAGKKYLKTYSLLISPNLNRSNLNVIAFVTDGNILPSGFTSFVFNVNAAKLGQTKIWN